MGRFSTFSIALSSILFAVPVLAEHTEISGKILDSHGESLPRAAAVLMDMNEAIVASTLAGGDGRFVLRTDNNGFFVLMLGGPGHHWLDVPLILDSSAQRIVITARLEVPNYKPMLTDLVLSGLGGSSPVNGKRLTRQPDGTYTLDLPVTGPEVLMTALGVANGAEAITLPGSIDYRLVGRTFYSVARQIDGRIRVVFDPRQLPQRGESGVQFSDPECRAAQIVAMRSDMGRWNRLANELWERNKKANPTTPEADLPHPEMPADWLARILGNARDAKDPVLRQAWLFEYLMVTRDNREHDEAQLRRALTGLTPASAFWQWNAALAAVAAVATGRPEGYQSYFTEMIDTLPDSSWKGSMIASLFTKLHREGRPDVAEPLLARMKAEFPENPRVKAAITRYENDRKIKPGNPVPEFAAPSLEDPKVIYTNASLKGKFYLIDFWATWCTPCAYQIPYLQRAYEKYRSKGFEIISYSVDGSREVVRKYRAERFPMPWLHAIDVELREGRSPLVKTFEVAGYPTAILVDARQGKIVAVGDEVAGEKLDRILARLMPD